VHVALTKRPIKQFKAGWQSSKQALRAYCSNIYTVDAGLHGGAIGDCATDSFSVSGSHFGSPAICGTNAGQHSKLQRVLFCKNLYTVFPSIVSYREKDQKSVNL
jgi:hypothetical protein